MASLNRIVLIGRLASDPELRYTTSNLAVASFTVAVDRPFSKTQGQEKKTDFFRCKAWRQKADFVSQYVQKGRLVALEGRVELNDYTGQDGVRKFFTEVVVDNIETLERARDGADGQGGNYPPEDYDGSSPAPVADRPAAAPRAAAPAAPRAAPPAPAAPRAPAAPPPPPPPRPVQPAYPDDDFDDSDPFADD